ncbi:peptidase U32 family protein [Candidatus Galacturonibacter soehngenii]|uniref:U32 family peptidase n=1 Tax=Candidatus Galacturonatibacter soehngenii TaxID=2307010 RepID=A0A7V7QM95_9FIRM|nr:U32 family peptidase [Candidatus Galacturonibacter soehngenii]KAB1439784.1 U32 family peptidase [Candidatus Galacturonibacter soehngenii]
MNKKKVELLAPAGSFEGMKAAINAGADAVYIGGLLFGARAYANNLDTQTLKEAIDYVHIHGKSLYLTVNTLLKNEELNEQLYDYIKEYYEYGLDAVIVQDMGVFQFIKENFPNLAIHASTQMSICGVEGAKLLKELGAQRVVTARELSLNELKEIHDQVDIEIESFVHGALCYCYSGQCLLSSFIGGRSGNRGRCAQPCRLPYKVMKDNKQINSNKETYVLSPKDMCTIDILPDIIEAGVYSFKIEGRMKKPEYAAGVVRIYRKYIDLYLEKGRNGYYVEETDRKELEDIFNRCGFNQGYYKVHNDRNMITLKEPVKRTRNEALYEELTKYIENESKEKIKGRLTLLQNTPAKLELEFKHIKVTTTGNVVEAAMKQPMDKDRIEKQILKTGNTPFVFESLEICMEDSIFLPIQSLNELRRVALENLQKQILSEFRRENSLNYKKELGQENQKRSMDEKPILNVYIEKEEYLKEVLRFSEVDGVYLDINFIDKPMDYYIDLCHKSNKKCILSLPHIFRNTKKTTFQPYESLLVSNLDGVLIKNYEEYQYIQSLGFKKDIIIDYNVYTFNDKAHEFWIKNNIAYDTAPVELNDKELLNRGLNESELIIYGHLPVMVSAQCIHKTIEKCDKKDIKLYLKDRMNKQFYVRNHCKYCYNVIYNCEPLVLLDNKKEIKALTPKSLRLHFTMEDTKDIAKIMQWYIDCYIYDKSVKHDFTAFTRGHFKRGIE